MSSFALFRMPYKKSCTFIRQTSGEPLEWLSCTALDGQSGFVVAPFAPSAETPILLIRPDEVQTGIPPCPLQLDGESLPPTPSDWRGSYEAAVDSPSRGRFLDEPSGRAERKGAYHIDFANFHAQLMGRSFKKLVLSRSLIMERQEDDTPLTLFQRACKRYPRMMICLAYTPKSGMWLTATPEILLSGSGSDWQTVALAGTMPYADHLLWNDKNIQEQRYVATYITEQLEQFASDVTEEGPRTIRAGHLAHLRSDFHFTLLNNARVGQLLQALHPTPAVCGLPKREAFQFIQQNEHDPRLYYSGFMGPLDIAGRTDLFVTLRCMQLLPDRYCLYAGGGILKDSTEEAEWQETEIKLDTMRNIINNV